MRARARRAGSFDSPGSGRPPAAAAGSTGSRRFRGAPGSSWPGSRRPDRFAAASRPNLVGNGTSGRRPDARPPIPSSERRSRPGLAGQTSASLAPTSIRSRRHRPLRGPPDAVDHDVCFVEGVLLSPPDFPSTHYVGERRAALPIHAPHGWSDLQASDSHIAWVDRRKGPHTTQVAGVLALRAPASATPPCLRAGGWGARGWTCPRRRSRGRPGQPRAGRPDP